MSVRGNPKHAYAIDEHTRPVPTEDPDRPVTASGAAAAGRRALALFAVAGRFPRLSRQEQQDLANLLATAGDVRLERAVVVLAGDGVAFFADTTPDDRRRLRRFAAGRPGVEVLSGAELRRRVLNS